MCVCGGGGGGIVARLGGAGVRALVCHMWAWLEKISVPSRLAGQVSFKAHLPNGHGSRQVIFY